MDYTALATTFNNMSLEELREVNRLVINQINHLHRQRDTKALARFMVGDLVEFTSEKSLRRVRARVDRINQKTLTLKEIEGAPVFWRVPPSMCRLVGA